MTEYICFTDPTLDLVEQEPMKESRWNSRGALTAVVASVALLGAGCGSGGGNNKDSIPKCDSTSVSGGVVKNTSKVLGEYVKANQLLLQDYVALGPDTSLEHRARVNNAVKQLYSFNTTSKAGGFLFNKLSGNGTNTRQLDPSTSKADDPSEIFCHIKDQAGDQEIVLSGEAVKAKIILEFAGDPVPGLSK